MGKAGRGEEKPASMDRSSERDKGRVGRRRGREEQKQKEREKRRECGKRARKVLLEAAAKDASCRDLKGRPAQMPEH